MNEKNAIDILKSLVGFDTTSSKSNLDLIEFIESYLNNHKIKSTLVYDSSGKKANLFATIGSGTDILDCAPEEVIVTITNPRNYFQYDVIDLATDAVLGTLVYDPEEGDSQVYLKEDLAKITDLGITVPGNSVYTMGINPQQTRIYGISYPDAIFFEYESRRRSA